MSLAGSLGASNRAESRPAVANSVLDHPIAPETQAFPGEQWDSSCHPARVALGGTDSRGGVLRVSTAVALLCSPVPPAMPLQGFYLSCALAAPRAGVGKGRAGSRLCLPRGCWSRPSLSTDLHAHQHHLCCLSTARDAGRAGLGAWAAVPGGLWAFGRALGWIIQGLWLAKQRLKGEPWDLLGKSLLGTSAVVLLVGLPSSLSTHISKGSVGGTTEEQPFPRDCPQRK